MKIVSIRIQLGSKVKYIQMEVPDHWDANGLIKFEITKVKVIKK